MRETIPDRGKDDLFHLRPFVRKSSTIAGPASICSIFILFSETPYHRASKLGRLASTRFLNGF